MPRAESHQRIRSVVRRIPRGRVATYGQVAELAGLPRQARLVGYVLHASEGTLPWQRVINARGEISLQGHDGADQLQRQLLEQEGVAFGADGRVDLERYRWRPRKKPGSC